MTKKTNCNLVLLLNFEFWKRLCNDCMQNVCPKDGPSYKQLNIELLQVVKRGDPLEVNHSQDDLWKQHLLKNKNKTNFH